MSLRLSDLVRALFGVLRAHMGGDSEGATRGKWILRVFSIPRFALDRRMQFTFIFHDNLLQRSLSVFVYHVKFCLRHSLTQGEKRQSRPSTHMATAPLHARIVSCCYAPRQSFLASAKRLHAPPSANPFLAKPCMRIIHAILDS